MLMFKIVHKVVSYIVLIFAQVTVSAGIYSYCNNRNIDTNLHKIQIALFFGTLLLLEVWHQLFLRRNLKDVLIYDPCTSMTLDQFDKLLAEGRKLVILDDRIIDLDNFEQNHPGGKHLIYTNIGRDISKFFHGGYSLENGATPHKHSNYAWTIVNEL